MAYGLAVNVICLLGVIPEMRQYLKFRREGTGEDLSEVMQLTGMGRGIYKMGRRFGVFHDPIGGTGDAKGR